ncbi:DUF5686 family protein [Fluviicola sp.]|uniref:DUF5686 family protein n=1 Tax=Fluviicola sp. TaxID=1917219 RepID=UPI0031D0AE36
MKYLLRSLLVLLIPQSFYAQQQIQIREDISKEPIPFVKVYPKEGKAFLADLDGRFTNPEGNTQVTLKMTSFRDTTIEITGDMTVYMTEQASLIDEVVILPGVNPAERIMELAIENRKKNHPKSDVAFKYDSYSKFVFTINQDALAQISDTVKDTNLLDLRKFFDQQHIFLLESTSTKFFKPPFKEKEVISAYRVSGFSDPMFSTFANQLQSFNFYDNQFDILGKTYLNPLALGSIRRYLFILEDTTITAPGDTTYTIRFQPRRDKNFEGMKGTLFINTKGFAVEKVIAEPAENNGGIHPKIIQEYVFLEGKKWFPYKLSTEVTAPGLSFSSKIKDAYLVGKGNTYIDHVVLNADLKDERFNAVFVETARDANSKDSSHWEGKRKYDLDEKDLRTYEFVDSLSEKENLEGKLKTFQSLLQGKIPLGYLQADILRLVNYRDYEGFRLGVGLETSDKLSDRFRVGGYFAYGFKDKMWKYGGYGKVTLLPKYFLDFEARYQQDIVERGGTGLTNQPVVTQLNSFYRDIYIRQMDKQRIGEIAFSGYIFPRMKFRLSGSYQRIEFTDNYTYQWKNTEMGSIDHYDIAESSLELIWAIRDKVMSLGTKRVSLGSKWPILTLKVTKSLPGVTAAKIDYTRLTGGVQQILPVRAVGKLTYVLMGTVLEGDAPLLLQQVGQGTGGMWKLSAANSFETMIASTYYSSRMAALFTRFDFKAIKTGKKWTKPQFSIHHAIGYGSKEDPSRHSIAFHSLDKGYAEAGALANSVIILNRIGFGIGGFYHYAGGVISPKVADNITAKFSINFLF